jgi:hypothetical protein
MIKFVGGIGGGLVVPYGPAPPPSFPPTDERVQILVCWRKCQRGLISKIWYSSECLYKKPASSWHVRKMFRATCDVLRATVRFAVKHDREGAPKQSLVKRAWQYFNYCIKPPVESAAHTYWRRKDHKHKQANNKRRLQHDHRYEYDSARSRVGPFTLW